MALWSFENVEDDNYIWALNDGVDIRSLSKITLWCDDIKWTET
jgi:hypothetical protein